MPSHDPYFSFYERINLTVTDTICGNAIPEKGQNHHLWFKCRSLWLVQWFSGNFSLSKQKFKTPV